MKLKISTALSVFIFFILIITSCTKSDLDSITNFNKVKIYDDSLIDPRNQSIRIASGNNRLFMTYCYDFEKWNGVNGALAIPPDPRTQWMITDNEGNIIRRDSFPTGLTIADVVFLKDNSCMAIVYDRDHGFSGNNYELLYYHFDENGNKISNDSIHLPADVIVTGPSLDDHQTVHLMQSSNGNAFMYFETYDQFTYIPISFASELNTDGTFKWYKKYADTRITDCTTTPDGGYMFVGFDIIDPYDQFPGYVSLMKTSGTGDSLWTKTFNAMNPYNVKIISGDNGDFFFCFNDTYFFTYKVNANGDSLNAFVINEVGRNLPDVLISKDGGAFTLINKDLTIYTYDGRLTDQSNTHFISLDANLKIIQRGPLQKQSTEVLLDACKTSDGKIACFGFTQIYDRRYYKPELIIVN